MKKVKYLLLTIVLCSFYGQKTCAQVIEANPVYPTLNEAVDITFNVDECDCNLEGYTGDIYAHTGLITSESTDDGDWHYVIAEWNEYIEKAKLEKINATTYVLHITPSIEDYYEISDETIVKRMAFVFKSSDGTKQSSNLYYDVYRAGLAIKLLEPTSNSIVSEGEQIFISAQSVNIGTPAADSLSLYINDEIQHVSYTDTLQHNIFAIGTGKFWIKVVAENPEYQSTDSVFFFIKDEIIPEELPNGLRDGINYLYDSSVTFVLYAPEKESVFLLGDFNDWEPDNDYLMTPTPDASRYWISIGDLDSSKEYAFQYLIDGSVAIADPYTEKILDPENDPYIPDETYPNLKAYPEKANGLVSIFQTIENEYSWNTENFMPASPENLIIYELHVQNYTAAASFNALTDTLDYLARLGINAVELMPINEFEGNQSWGYNPSFYFAVDKIYGTKNDFKAFVDACHEKNIAVIIDLVLNHSYGQSPLVQMYWDESTKSPASNNPWYNESHNFVDNTSAHWGYDFDHESQVTRDLIDSINSFWLSEYKIDGFRFDFTKGFSNTQWTGSDNWASAYDESRITILKRMADEIWERNPNAYVIFEHLADNSEEKVLADYGILLWGNMNHNYNEATMGYNESDKSDLSWGIYSSRDWDDPNLITYMESHDEERLMYKNQEFGNSSSTEHNVQEKEVSLNRMETALAFFLTIPGPKMLFQWGELGYDYSINRCTDGTVDETGGCRLSPKPLGWDFFADPQRYRLLKVYGALIDFKLSDACKTENFTFDLNSATKSIHLNTAEINTTIIGNFDVVDANINPEFQHSGTWYDYMTGESITISDEDEEIMLSPGEYHIYTDVELETPDLPTAIDKPGTKKDFSSIVYPNPTHGNFYVEMPFSGKALFELFTLDGRNIYAVDLHINEGKSSEIKLDKRICRGIYIYQLTSDTKALIHYSAKGMLILE